MEKNLLVIIAAILSTLLEEDGAPESVFYIFCDMNLRIWQVIRESMLDKKWIAIRGFQVFLTPEGKTMAEKLNQAIGA